MSLTRRTCRKTIRTFRVLYVVTRKEFYEVETINAQHAEEAAFSEGRFVESGEATDITCLNIEQISAPLVPRRSRLANTNGGDQ